MKKKVICLVIAFLLLFTISSAFAASESSTPKLDTSNLKNGIIGISYYDNTDLKLKLKVQRVTDAKDVVYYNLFGTGKMENFSLQYGNGQYKISVLKQKEGNRYSQVASFYVNLSIADKNKIYLESIQNVNWNVESEVAKKATELTKGLETDNQKIMAIYKYIVDNFTYDYEKINRLTTKYVPNPDEILNAYTGICYDFSTVLASMLRSQGIPTKLVKGYADSMTGYHAWNEVYFEDEDRWVLVDTTYDLTMKSYNAPYAFEKDMETYEKVFEY